MVESVLTNEGFQVSAPDAAVAKKIASTFLKWLEEQPETFSTFATNLVSSLESCFQACRSRSKQIKSEKVWGHYHVLCTSSSYKELWNQILARSGNTPSPTFYQFVTHELFKELLKREFPVSSDTTKDVEFQALTIEEENALRYVAGYICRKVRKNLESSKNTRKDDMIFCLFDMSGDDGSSDSDDGGGGSEKWTNLIDRGGLWHVSNETYTLFCVMEEELCQHLTTDTVHKQQSGSKQKIIDIVLKNEDVLFQWSILTSTLDDNLSSTLLDIIVKEYVTLRGFAFGASCLELYKQKTKKTLQKKKGIRKKLFT